MRVDLPVLLLVASVACFLYAAFGKSVSRAMAVGSACFAGAVLVGHLL